MKAILFAVYCAWYCLCALRACADRQFPFPAAGAALLWWGAALLFRGDLGRRASGVDDGIEKLRYDAIIGLPDGQCWVLRYRGPAWRVAGQGGMERMTNQIASGRVLLETLQELCGDIPGLAVRVVPGRLVQDQVR